MRLIGVVSRVQPLDAREGKVVTSVSIEGVNVLVSDGVPVPEAGIEINAVCSVSWPREKGKRPTLWLKSFVKV